LQVLDKGWVELDDFMGSDKKIVKRARVSNIQPSLRPTEKRTNAQDQGLINYLIKNRHGSPFEGAIFEFYVKCPLFVRSEWHRHRMASYNEMSGRYVQYQPEFYIPDLMRIQGTTNKQGSLVPDEEWAKEWYKDQHTNVYQPLQSWNVVARASIEASSEQAYAWYLDLIEHKKVAKEMARMVLPPNLYTAFYMTVNARSLMNFLSLRNADNAQWEIRQYAVAMETMFKKKMPMTYKAWVANDRLAP
jgi:thymidylate synthase (FAD)